MPTPPTFVAEYETDWTATTTPKTVSVTVSAGDTLAIFGMTGDASFTLATPTGGGLTYTLQQSVVVSAFGTVYLWTAPAPGSQTFTMSVTESGGSALWAYNCLRFSGSAGVGASNKTNVSGGAPSLGLTTTGANSAIVVASVDWNAVDGASRTWRSAGTAATEQTYSFTTSQYAVYGAYHADSGAAGAKTVGLTAPTGQKYSIAAMEILGSSATPTPPPVYQMSQYGSFH
jgi:hypothetical protein